MRVFTQKVFEKAFENHHGKRNKQYYYRNLLILSSQT